MAQAERVTTAIRELMSRGQPPKSTSPRAAHTEFIAALAGNAPHPINPKPNSADLERCADHLEKVLAALHVYLTAIIADIPAARSEPRPRPEPAQLHYSRRPDKKTVAWGICMILLPATLGAAFLTYYAGFLVLFMFAFIGVTITAQP